MFVSLELFQNVTGHRNVEPAGDVVPGEFYAAIEVAAPVLAQFFVLVFYRGN
jgi:hypothetical protein